MRRIRETLRLHLQAGLSYNEVGRALKIYKSAIGKYVSLARVHGVDWALAQTLSDEELEARLYRPALPRSSFQLTGLTLIWTYSDLTDTDGLDFQSAL